MAEDQIAQASLPEGVYEGTRAKRRSTMSPEKIRQIADEESADLTRVDSYGEPSGYREAVSVGETPSDIFARTEIRSPEEAVRMARYFALQIDILKQDPLWADEVWLSTDDPASAFLYLRAVFMKSLYRQSSKEGTLMHVGMIPGEFWELPDSPPRKRKRRPQ